MKSAIALVVLTLALLPFATLACTETATPAPQAKSEAVTKKPTPAKTAPAAKPSKSCDAQTDNASCIQCCETQTGASYKELLQPDMGDCICEPSAACADACQASLCGASDPDSACTQCLDSTPEEAIRCVAAAKASCKTNDACAPTLACVESSGCDAKP